MILPPPTGAMGDLRPALFFLIDVSIPAHSSGYKAHVLTSLKSIIPSIPESTFVFFGTMANDVHVFDFSKSTEYLVSDSTDVVLPRIPPVALGNARDQLDRIIDRLLTEIPSPAATGHCIGTAYEVAELVLGRTGGLFVVACQGIPTIGRYALKPRVSAPSITEVPLLRFPAEPSSRFYRDVGVRLNRRNISVHLFAYSDGAPVDTTVIGVASCFTNGRVNVFNRETIHRFHGELFAQVTEPYLAGAMLQLRVASKVKVARFFGNFVLLPSTKMIGFPALRMNESVTFELVPEAPIKEKELFVQAGLFWINNEGRRVLRVMTFGIPVTDSVAAIQESMDPIGLLASMARRAVRNVLAVGSAEALAIFKNEVSKMISKGAAPSYVYHLTHALAVSPILVIVPVPEVDNKIVMLTRWRSVHFMEILLTIYPRMFAVDTDVGPLALVSESFGDGSVFLFHLPSRILMWISSAADQIYIQDAFGVPDLGSLPDEVPKLDSKESEDLNRRIEECWDISGKYLPVEILVQGNPKEVEIASLLVDTQPANPNLGLEVWIRELRRF
jgi:hypothetical protein